MDLLNLLSAVILFSFLASILMLFRFSRYIRLLSGNHWTLEPEETKRYQAKARASLKSAGILAAACVVFIILAFIISCFQG